MLNTLCIQALATILIEVGLHTDGKKKKPVNGSLCKIEKYFSVVQYSLLMAL